MNIKAVWAPPTADVVELVVDVSNVCRDITLDATGDAARWDRLDRLADAWARWQPAFEKPRVRLVVDSSLWDGLSSHDRRLLKTADAEGWAEIHDYADDPILDIAEQYGCLVLSRDQFLGHRRQRPWIDVNAHQFISWSVADGEVSLHVADLRQRTGFSMSRAEERDELKALHLKPNSPSGAKMLSSVYRCDNPRCIRRAFGSPDAEVAPTPGDLGEAVCQGCKEPLTRVGRRSETAILKLTSVGGAERVERVPLAKGSSLVIGRASHDLSLKGLLDEPGLSRMSREHLRVSFDGLRVVATSLSSSNGTTLQAWDATARSHFAPVDIRAGVDVVLGPRDRLVLAGLLSVERSGRRYPFDLAPPAPTLGASASGSAN